MYTNFLLPQENNLRAFQKGYVVFELSNNEYNVLW